MPYQKACLDELCKTMIPICPQPVLQIGDYLLLKIVANIQNLQFLEELPIITRPHTRLTTDCFDFICCLAYDIACAFLEK